MLEWADDLELFILKGYGNSLNYQMGAPLLEDVLQSMEQAIKAQEGNINFLISHQCSYCIAIPIKKSVQSALNSFFGFTFHDWLIVHL